MRWRKIIQLGQHTITVHLIWLSRSPLCLIQAVIHPFTLMPQTVPNSLAFCHQEWHHLISMFNYKPFVTLLKVVLSELGLNYHDYGTHSFCHWGPSFTLEAGVSSDTICIMGIGNWTPYFSLCICL